MCRCCCGQARQTHPTIPGIDPGSPGDIWLPNKHTRPHATDAYGTIEFQGGAHPTKAQVTETMLYHFIPFISTINTMGNHHVHTVVECGVIIFHFIEIAIN